jgi:hypothetical protein
VAGCEAHTYPDIRPNPFERILDDGGELCRIDRQADGGELTRNGVRLLELVEDIEGWVLGTGRWGSNP